MTTGATLKLALSSLLLAGLAAAAIVPGPAVAGEPDGNASTTAGMPADCPFHAAHMAARDAAAAAARRQEVDARGDVAMGFRHDLTTHHFYETADGGIIQVTANDANDATTIGQVRAHLQHIAEAFSKGDFSIPQQVHAEVPPGVPTMEKEAGVGVLFRYEEVPAGGRVAIAARTPETVAAVHSFLGYQIDDHGTGDAKTDH